MISHSGISSTEKPSEHLSSANASSRDKLLFLLAIAISSALKGIIVLCI